MSSKLLKYRRICIILSQIVLLVLAYYLSFLLRFDFRLEEPYRSVFFETLPLLLVIKLLTFLYFKLFRGWWRYVGIRDLFDIIKAASSSAVLFYWAVSVTRGIPGFPRSIFIIDMALTILAIGGMRFAVRVYSESAHSQQSHVNALIVGAGSSGSAIATEIHNNDALGYNLIGFVDDDPAKAGERIHGIKVLGKTDDLRAIVERHDIALILIAIPSATGRQMQKIIRHCVESRIVFKTLPALGDIINGSVSFDLMRRVKVEDLLAREPVRLELAKIQKRVEGRIIFISGAGGSIGSELVRQVSRFKPAKVVLFDRSENDLHRLELELADSFPHQPFVSIVGDILDESRLRDVFTAHRPSSVFHAAAYKHVPMMERNCFQAVVNNIFGTLWIARMAQQCGIPDFVMISSDKAVNPSSIMGVTKRIAEILILGMPEGPTRFVSVRFGNVLGSSGSVVPLFEQQIAMRKPVTVTDPEVRRYFMTIPEAVQLVLQASTMGKGGEIFVLDMGEPVRIVDLAQNLIVLSGLEPGKDIPIIFTGLRPGEKLFEELRLDGEGIKPTAHEKIRVLDGGPVDAGRLNGWLDELDHIVREKDVAQLISKLQEIVPEYTPSAEIRAIALSGGRPGSHPVTHPGKIAG